MRSLQQSILKLFILVHCSLLTHAQNPTIDSLKNVLETQKEDTNKVNTLNAICKKLIEDQDTSMIFKFADQAIELADKINFTKGKATALGWIANMYVFRFNYPAARKYILEALEIRNIQKDKKSAADLNMALASLYGIEENYPEALKIFYSNLKLLAAIGNNAGIINTWINVGTIYYLQENLTEALNAYQQSLKLLEGTGMKSQLAQNHCWIAGVYVKQGNYKKSLQEDSIALKLYEEIGEQEGIAEVYSIDGNAYEKEGELTLQLGNKVLADTFFAKSLAQYFAMVKIFETMRNEDGIAEGYLHLGNLHNKLNRISRARDYYQKCLKKAALINKKQYIRDSYLGLSLLDSIQGKYKQAYDHYKTYTVYRDSLVNEEGIKKSESYKLQYEFDKKEAIAKAQQEKKDAETQRVKNVQYFAIAALGILVLSILLIAFIQWRNSKHRQLANLLLQQQKEKVETTLSELKSTQSQLIQSEKMASLGELTAGIAHEIQNPLNFVNNFSEVNSELIGELEQEVDKGNYDEVKAIAKDIKDNEQKINHHGKRADAIVKGMLQHSQSSSGQKEPTNINKLSDEYLRLSYQGLRTKDKSFNATLKNDFDESIGNINIIPQDIGRVLLNLYNNAFYAVNEKKKLNIDGYEPTVSVTTKNIGDKILITVKDNGNGIPQKIVDKIFQPFFTTKPTGQGTGLGLSLSYDVIKAHGGEINVDTEEGKGSEFKIILPVNN